MFFCLEREGRHRIPDVDFNGLSTFAENQTRGQNSGERFNAAPDRDVILAADQTVCPFLDATTHTEKLLTRGYLLSFPPRGLLFYLRGLNGFF